MKLLLVIAGVLLASWPQGAQAESKQIRIATLAPSGSPWMQLLERAGAEIAKQTDQRVTVNYLRRKFS